MSKTITVPKDVLQNIYEKLEEVQRRISALERLTKGP